MVDSAGCAAIVPACSSLSAAYPHLYRRQRASLGSCNRAASHNPLITLISPSSSSGGTSPIWSLEHVQRRALNRRNSRLVAGCTHRLLLQFPSNRTAEDASIAQVNFEFGRTRQRTLDQRFRERILDVFLQRAT